MVDLDGGFVARLSTRYHVLYLAIGLNELFSLVYDISNVHRLYALL